MYINNMRELLEIAASQLPDNVALTFIEPEYQLSENITYKVLVSRVKTVAAQLQQRVRQGDRVLLLYPPGIDFIIGFFACMYSGVIAVPCFPPLNFFLAERIRLISIDAMPACILTNSFIAKKIKLLKLADFVDKPGLKKLTNAILPSSVKGILEAKLTYFLKLPLIITDDNEANEFTEKDYHEINIKENAISFLQYTSGTTSQPKGVIVTHDNLLANITTITRKFALTADEIISIWLPPYHDMGLIGGILTPIHVHCAVYLMSPTSFLKNPFHWVKIMSDLSATASVAPNFAYDLVVERISEEEAGQLNLKNWHKALNGAEPIRKKTLDKFSQYFSSAGFKINAFLPCYGLAEATLLVSSASPNNPYNIRYVDTESFNNNKIVFVDECHSAKPLVSSGVPDKSFKLLIVDPETKQTCPENVVGEIWLQGKSVTPGYWNNHKYTSETYHAYLENGEGPFLRTGDMGFINETHLYVTGRLKDLVIIHGKNYYPHDIELTIESNSNIVRTGRSAVFSINLSEEEVIIAIVEMKVKLDDNKAKQKMSLIKTAVMREHGIPIYEIIIVPPKTLYKTTSGKIQRNKMKELYLTNKLSILFKLRN